MIRMAFGYAYPAFKCFKTVEKNRDDIEELRFWCQYWIILVAVAVFERVADILICWLPLYGELKLAIIIYMWHPKTKGTAVVYNALLRPFITKHENDIDKNLNECKARFWDLSIFCWQNCAGMVQDAFFQLLQELASQTRNFSENSMKVAKRIQQPGKLANSINLSSKLASSISLASMLASSISLASKLANSINLAYSCICRP
ncbi:hypothetical protein SAY87_026715 [Trapa incisa]|uniref:HVA22-like protein n=1 Tax=Trapa incisa TaxID=236973 RepID=A0AAN7GQP3_9MYRT|nr:hypothetical protein SAY87_026715 [Trapa incisa]